MKVEWKKLMFGLVIGAGMMMMASCSDEENFDPGPFLISNIIFQLSILLQPINWGLALRYKVGIGI